MKKLRGTPAIDELQYGSDWLDRFSAFVALLKFLGWSLGGLLLAATIFVISNTIRLNIFARRDEIEIMRAVGATGLFIRAPFYLEGILQGVIGACVRPGDPVRLSSVSSSMKVYEPMRGLLGNFPVHFLNTEQIAAVALGGVILGLLGTQVSVGRYLRI